MAFDLRFSEEPLITDLMRVVGIDSYDQSLPLAGSAA